jgi:hypothetical protein
MVRNGGYNGPYNSQLTDTRLIRALVDLGSSIRAEDSLALTTTINSLFMRFDLSSSTSTHVLVHQIAPCYVITDRQRLRFDLKNHILSNVWYSGN